MARPRSRTKKRSAAAVRVMAFGVFDSLHPGHLEFLRQAKSAGDHLTVVVARPASVQHHKGHAPRHTLRQRLQFIRSAKLADRVVASDREDGHWLVIRRHRPHIIALGYDQHDLRRALFPAAKEFDPPLKLRRMRAHQPRRYHTRLLRRKKL